MQLRLTTLPAEDPSLQVVATLSGGRNLRANIADASLDCTTTGGCRILLFGDVFYHLNGDFSIRQTTAADTDYLAALFEREPLTEIVSRLEGQYVGLRIDASAGTVELFSDRYARQDAFYASPDGHLIMASDMDFIFQSIAPEYDQLMLAHMFSVYGWYTPKGLTLYKNVKQLQVGEIMTLSADGIASRTIPFEPLEIEDLGDDALETYYQYLRESIVSRAAGQDTVWVSSSSGWDSSTILAMLVQELGADRVRMIAGSMKYSERTETINKFEIDKVHKIGDFFGITPEVVVLDMESRSAGDYWQSVLPHYKSRHMYSIPTFNFAKISDGLQSVAGDGKVIFNGETSDSFHNFGFSQFCTFFHTQKSFTEYADKMNCYLYGPSFLKKILDGTYSSDRVYRIFQAMMPGVQFDAGSGDRAETIERFLFPLFYGGPRLPFATTYVNPALNAAGQAGVLGFPFRQYMPDVLDRLAPENLYSWYIQLYMSFHSQGSTVGVHKHAMAAHNHQPRMPFNDYRLINLLSRAPERWGRGLDMNNTKYPLKWVARNKIRFPYALLDEGAHSYLYDVIEGFSLHREITYNSGVAEFFKATMTDRPYRNLLTDEYLDTAYLDRLVDDYLDGKEAQGADFTNLVSLITLCITGWY